LIAQLSATPSQPGRYVSVPTVLRVDGFRFFFFSNEGTEAPHIHVERSGGHAKFWLNPVTVASARELREAELKRAKLLVIQHRLVFIEKWHEYFGA
jgi:hypothetical protein